MLAMEKETIKAPHYLIAGGKPLRGEVVVSGAKNAVTKMVITSLLTADLCTLRNVPLLGDLFLTFKLCEGLGSYTHLDGNTLSVRTTDICETTLASAVGVLNRIGVLTIGRLLHRCGEVIIPRPGGDRIGPRPIDFHLHGLRQMGAKIVEQNGHYHCSAPKPLQGTTIKLPFPSVMATENFLITACLARGVTVIENAAIEPEIIDLIKLLQKMGAIIELKVNRLIFFKSVDRLHEAHHTLLTDRFEAASF